MPALRAWYSPAAIDGFVDPTSCICVCFSLLRASPTFKSFWTCTGAMCARLQVTGASRRGVGGRGSSCGHGCRSASPQLAIAAHAEQAHGWRWHCKAGVRRGEQHAACACSLTAPNSTPPADPSEMMSTPTGLAPFPSCRGLPDLWGQPGGAGSAGGGPAVSAGLCFSPAGGGAARRGNTGRGGLDAGVRVSANAQACAIGGGLGGGGGQRWEQLQLQLGRASLPVGRLLAGFGTLTYKLTMLINIHGRAPAATPAGVAVGRHLAAAVRRDGRL